jgi:hypothetical protein
MKDVTFAKAFSFSHPGPVRKITDYPKGYTGKVGDDVAAAALRADALTIENRCPKPSTKVDAVAPDEELLSGKVSFEG